MTSIIIGPSSAGGGATPIGQTALFPAWYPNSFVLQNQTFVRTGQKVLPEDAHPDLSQFRKLNRKHSAPQISAADVDGFVISNAMGIAPGRTVLVGGQGCVYRSADFGKSWTKIIVSAMATGYLYGIAGNGNGVWIGQINGTLWRSADDGLTWATVSSVTVLNNVSSRTTYLGNSTFITPGSAGSAIMRSTDNGLSWSAITMPAGYLNNSHLCTAGSFAGTAIIQARHSTLVDAVYYRSFDSGATWSAATWFDGSPATVRVAAMQDEPITPSHIAFGENGRVIALRRKRHEEDVPNVWRGQIYTSTNGGLTFTLADTTLSAYGAASGVQSNGSVESLCYIGDDKYIYRLSQNEINGNLREAVQTLVLTFSLTNSEIRNTAQAVVGAGTINQGTDAKYPHVAIELYDHTTGESVFVVIASSGSGNSHFVSVSDEVIGILTEVGAYTGSGGGYQSGLVHYLRTA